MRRRPLHWSLSFLFVFPVLAHPNQVHLSHGPASAATTKPLTFQLRHIHASNSTHAFFADVRSEPPSQESPPGSPEHYAVDTRIIRTHRPSSFAAHSRARLKSFTSGVERKGEQQLRWGEEEVLGPDVTDRDTLLGLAKMTNNAYAYPNNSRWYDLGSEWNVSFPFGWEDDDDGFRGHVFATPDNSTVVISIKGTSAGLFGGGATSKKDKLNDNLLFSCCCAAVGFTWSPVCGCYAGGSKCDRNCLEESLIEDSLFYPIGTNLYNNVSYMYPDSTIWLVGHSLGGALASLLGVTFGAPVVAFEAPGEKMAAQRLHLPSPPSTQHVTHVYHTADPIPMGTCNGVLSLCAIGGYAMESRCHLGQSSVYDTVTRLNWNVDIRTHPIQVVIERLLSNEWHEHEGLSKGNVSSVHDVPVARPEDNCIECYHWEYGHYLDPRDWRTFR